MRHKRILITAVCGLALAACSESSASGGSGGAMTGDLKAEEFCTVEGLEAPLRQTFILVDDNMVNKTEDPREFVALNANVRDVVLAVADPQKALASGVTEARERVSIFVLPSDGGAAERAFSGCLPGLSADEMAQAKQESSALGDFFTGGASQKIENSVNDFRMKLVASLQYIARNAAGPAEAPDATIAEASFIKSLRASNRLVSGDGGVPRVFLYTDVSQMDFPKFTSQEEARAAGFADGKKIGLDFNRADVFVILPEAGDDLIREYFQAFLLAQHARLAHWGGVNMGAVPIAPASVQRFVGKVQYPDSLENVRLRISVDKNGKLSDSWIILEGTPDRSTPMTGQAVCKSRGECNISSDSEGFAQAWSLAPGGEPEFDPDGPFGHMRRFEFNIDGKDLSGRIFDPAVDQIGSKSGNDSLTVEAVEIEGATF